MKNLARIALVTALLAGCGSPSLSLHRDAQVNLVAAKSVPGQVVVKFKSDVERLAFHRKHDSRTIKRIRSLNLDVVELKNPCAVLTRDENAVYVEPDYVYTVDFEPNDRSYGEQYALKNVEAPKTWEITRGDPDTVIAIVDTGIDLDHPDLKEKLVPGYNAIDPSKPPDDDSSHGTHCAGSVAASTNNGIGIAGLSSDCKLMPIKVMNERGQGSVSDIADGITWAVDHGAKVISFSIGGPGGGAVLREAVDYALKKNVPVIAAMGNEGTDQVSYPAAYPGVLAVGSSDKDDKISESSQYGTWISVCAPGVGIYSTTPNHDSYLVKHGKTTRGYGIMSGTSMATPYVAGLAALIRSRFPELTPAQVKERIEKSCDKVQGRTTWDEEYGNGRINAVRALTR